MRILMCFRYEWLFIVLSIIIVGCGSEKPIGSNAKSSNSPQVELAPNTSTDARQLQIQQARTLQGEGSLGEAIQVLQTVLIANPNDIEALTLAAKLSLQAGEFDEAEEMLRELLDFAASDNGPRRQLIDLLNQRGRRHEAVVLTRQLCQSNDITEFELKTLILEADVLYLPASRQPVESKSYPPLKGNGAKGRFLLANAYFDEAVTVLEQHINDGDACQSDIAMCGVAIAEAQQSDKFPWWLEQTSPATREFPEYWAAIGAHLLLVGEFRGSIGALGHAILRDPTDIRSIRRMSKAFYSIGDRTTAERWMQRHQDLASTLQAKPFDPTGRRLTVKDPAKLVRALDRLGRRLEAAHWRIVFAENEGAPSAQLRELRDAREQVLHDQASLGTTTEKRVTPSPPQAKFTNVASDVGLEHTYRVHSSDRKNGFAIYQTFGGGVAVIDFDLDGSPDLYFAQGAAEPPRFLANRSDMLYRSLMDSKTHELADVTAQASITEDAYTLGVTSGDWNQDGFLDLVISNLGPDYLLINQGDGTFISRCLDSQDGFQRLSTSVAMGDLNGDHLPDLFQLNYLDDVKQFERPPMDSLGRAHRTAAPYTFHHSLDRVWMNDGQVGWTAHEVGETGKHRSTGLGLIVSDLDPTQPGNEVYVANDEQADHLWRFDQPSQAWRESARQAGLAFGSLGFPVGSMGVAAADFDQSGTLDLNVDEAHMIVESLPDTWER